MFHTSQTHISFLHQQFSQIRIYLKNINERNFKTADDYSRIEKTLQYSFFLIRDNLQMTSFDK